GKRARGQVGDWFEARVEDIDFTGAEIGGVEQGAAISVGRDGQALVNRPARGARARGVVHGNDRMSAGAARAVKLGRGIDPGIPAGNGAVFGGEKEYGRCDVRAVANHETSVAGGDVEDSS